MLNNNQTSSITNNNNDNNIHEKSYSVIGENFLLFFLTLFFTNCSISFGIFKFKILSFLN